jgi:hypothetical protein
MLAGFWADWGWIIAFGFIYVILLVSVIRTDSKIQLFLVGLWRGCLPELELFPSREKGPALRRATNNWRTNSIVVPIVVVGYVMTKYLGSSMHSMFALPRGIVSSIVALMWFGLSCWSLWLSRTLIRRRLREELIEDGFAICRSCGYDLRGLTESRCPECGTPFDKRLLTDNNLETPADRQLDDSER